MYKTIVRGKEFRYSIFFTLLILVFTLGDILIDINEGVSFNHVFHEVLVLAFSVVLIIFHFRANVRKSQKLGEVNKQLEQVNLEKENFRLKVSEHAKAFSQAVEDQFNNWDLTSSEREIAVLLIKGLSMKEIANLRDSQETTVRQQATSIYKKSKLENRQHLAAYFLEDMF